MEWVWAVDADTIQVKLDIRKCKDDLFSGVVCASVLLW